MASSIKLSSLPSPKQGNHTEVPVGNVPWSVLTREMCGDTVWRLLFGLGQNCAWDRANNNVNDHMLVFRPI